MVEGARATGRRKEAVAKVRVFPGSGKVHVNGKPLGEYFPKTVEEATVIEPFVIANAAGKYDVAASEFRRYLESFSRSDNADHAQYWIGECFYSLGRLDSAEAAFRQVIVAYPHGKKLPAAEYKLALVYLAQNHKAEATNQLRRVVKEYPGTNEAGLAQKRLESPEQ